MIGGGGVETVEVAPGPARRSPARIASAAALGLAAFGVLLALGTWQVHRLSWKLALIARVDARVHAPPRPPPPPAEWADVTAADAYEHVDVAGRFLNDRVVLVQATTELGAGYWMMVPLRTAADGTVFVNRGFIPSDERAAVGRLAVPGPATVTGLLRVSEPKGLFLRRNDPAADRWSSRDVPAMAAKLGLRDVAPYFIDADATPNPGGLPVGGLTVVSFPNNHLVYAFTWYSLAAMLGGAGAWFAREEWRARQG